MKIKEILATTANKMAHKSHDNALEDYKAKVMARIDEVIKNGMFECAISQLSCPDGCWKEIREWLGDLGYVVDWKCGSSFADVKWDDLSVIKTDMMTEPKPATTKYYGTTPAGVSYAWDFDENSYDFVCAHCDGHSEYTTDYCPNCGAKMHLRIGDRRRSYETR